MATRDEVRGRITFAEALAAYTMVVGLPAAIKALQELLVILEDELKETE